MASSKATVKDFEALYPSLVEDVLNHVRQYQLPENGLQWFKEVSWQRYDPPPRPPPAYTGTISPSRSNFRAVAHTPLPQSLTVNPTGGKYNRGLSVVDSFNALHPASHSSTAAPTAEDTFLASVLGWLTELLQAFFLVSDDLMDSSITRRGSPCWFRRPGVGLVAVNDAFMLESCIYVLLRRHFKARACYVDLLELFHEVTLQTECGQLMDLLTAPEDHVELDRFSMEKFGFIVRHKTAFYSFYLPVALAVTLAGLATEKNLDACRKILVPLGEYFQIQDDYLDAFGAPEVIGKVGTDIRDNKCSWLVNQALERCTPAQRKVLEENYGRKDDEKEERVVRLYREMELDKVYLAEEERRVKELREMIAAVDESGGLKRSVFEAFLNKIYKRQK